MTEGTLASTVNAMVAEYTALRQEMRLAAEHQREMIKLALALLTAAGAFVAIIADMDDSRRADIAAVLLIVPVICSLLALTSADAARRILALAGYVNADLRHRLKEVLGTDVWQWESFWRKTYDGLPKARRRQAQTLDKARWLVFFLPGVVSIVAYYSLVPRPPCLHVILSVLGTVFLIASVVILDWSERTSGTSVKEVPPGPPPVPS